MMPLERRKGVALDLSRVNALDAMTAYKGTTVGQRDGPSGHNTAPKKSVRIVMR